MPDSYESSMSYMGSLGIPITDIQELCKAQYIEWHKKRLHGLLAHPLLNEDVPSVVVFPEGSIPVDCLKMLHDFAKSTRTTVVAGSHTILGSIEAKQVYSMLGKEKTLAKPHTHSGDVTFIFVQDKIHHQKKQGVSPFDRTDLTSLIRPSITLHPLPIPIGNSTLRMVSLVCADALQLPKIKGDYDIVSVISYDPDPSHFKSFIGTQVENSRIVIYCNDGKFGGSSINLPLDRRPTSWFFEQPLSGHLPQGDALLIIDVPVGELATQVGVHAPKAQREVKFLASITYEGSVVGDQEVSKELCKIKNISNNQVRNSRLASLLGKHTYNHNQGHRLDLLHELSRTGVDADDVWAAYGLDLVLDLPGLVDLEAKFAKVCDEKLTQQLIEGDLESQGVERLQAFLRECKSRISVLGETESLIRVEQPAIPDAYINREDEIAKMLSFLDSRNEFLMEVSSLAQMGKSATIEKALARTGFKRIKRILLLTTSSVEYILAEIFGEAKGPVAMPIPGSEFTAELQQAIKEWDVLWFENCQELLVSGQWKSGEIQSLINNIVSIVQEETI